MADPAAPALPTHAIAPDGRAVEIQPGKEGAAEAAGYRVLTGEEFAADQLAAAEPIAGPVKAGLEHAASAATLGLSDVAAGAIGGDEYREGRALRDVAFPTSGAVGTGIGIAAPALLSGGESLLGTAARSTPTGAAMALGRGAEGLVEGGLARAGLTGESLLGRAALGAAKSGASGAVEGAAFGAGNALSEAALAPGGNYDDIGQKLWAGAIDGSEFGGVAGGALGGFAGLGEGIASKIGGSVRARQLMQDAADAHTLKGSGIAWSDMKKFTPEKRASLARVLREEPGIGALDDLGQVAGKLRESRAETGKVLGEMRAKLDELAQPGEQPNLGKVLGDIKARADELRANAADQADVSLANKLERRYAPLAKRIEGVTAPGELGGKVANDPLISFKESTDIRKRLDDQLEGAYKRLRRGDDVTPLERELMKVRQNMESEFERSAEAVMSRTDPNFATAYTDQKARYGAMADLSKIATKRAAQEAGNQSISITDKMSALAGASALGPAGLLAGVANRVLRSSQTDRAVGHLLDKLASIDTKVNSSVARFVDRSRKAAKGVVRGSISDIAAGEATGGFAGRRERAAGYYKKLAAVEREANSPAGTLVSIPGAPNVQAAAEKARRHAATWLLQQAPRPPAQVGHPMLARMARQSPPSDAEMLKWNRQVKIVEKPLSILSVIESGRLTTDQVDALKATAPAFLEQIRKTVLEHVTDSDSDLDYAGRIAIGNLLDVVTDPSMRPESIALSQEVYETRREEEQAQEAQQNQPAAPSAPGQQAPKMVSRVDQLEEGSVI